MKKKLCLKCWAAPSEKRFKMEMVGYFRRSSDKILMMAMVVRYLSWCM